MVWSTEVQIEIPHQKIVSMWEENSSYTICCDVNHFEADGTMDDPSAWPFGNTIFSN